ncbi:hypothetical protein OQJ62_14030 [Microbulbifer thermotolerans]|uniref:hypothetical protein n=1 Tax=Microbulbifer thermotolerans TaxID=252514 RepID=UPI0022497077|nr:hypothetical protein [Microbulbifer thermotolerans]MCX2796041.1 hypothetical protein [Microbulbifer thermotolerans]
MLIGTEKKPKGPKFSRSRPIEKNLSYTRLKFLAPPHKDPFSDLDSWETEPKSIDIDDRSIYRSRKLPNGKNLNGFFSARAYSSRWAFCGIPLLQGYCGHMNLLVDVNLVDNLPINETLFDNNVLTREVYNEFLQTELNDLHEGYSDDPLDVTQYRWPSYLGPINCQWSHIGDSDWLYFEDQPLMRKNQTIFWNVAISDKQYLSFRFVITRSARNAGNPYRIEQRVPRDNFLALMHKIMDSLTLDLNPKAAARRAQVQAQPGASDKPILTCTPEQVEEAKHVLYMWSGRGYEEPGKSRDDDHRANPEDVAAFIEERIKPRPLPNSYPPGELLKLAQQPT